MTRGRNLYALISCIDGVRVPDLGGPGQRSIELHALLDGKFGRASGA